MSKHGTDCSTGCRHCNCQYMADGFCNKCGCNHQAPKRPSDEQAVSDEFWRSTFSTGWESDFHRMQLEAFVSQSPRLMAVYQDLLRQEPEVLRFFAEMGDQ